MLLPQNFFLQGRQHFLEFIIVAFENLLHRNTSFFCNNRGNVRLVELANALTFVLCRGFIDLVERLTWLLGLA